MATDIPAHSLFSSPDRRLLENVVLQHDNGIITDISAGAEPSVGPRSLVIPAFINAHDHARPTASSFGALGMPLESWILRSARGGRNSREKTSAGVGDVKDDRMARAIGIIVEGYQLARAPTPAEIFSREFLPPRAERELVYTAN